MSYGNGIQLHPRTQVVSKAKCDFWEWFVEFENSSEFTYSKLVQLLSVGMIRLSDNGDTEVDVSWQITQSQYQSFMDQLNQTVDRHSLTNGEIIQILAGEIVSLMKYAIRAERHPNDPKKAGDEA